MHDVSAPSLLSESWYSNECNTISVGIILELMCQTRLGRAVHLHEYKQELAEVIPKSRCLNLPSPN